MGKKFGFEFLKKLYCNDLDMLQIHPLDSWKIPAWEEPCTWEGHRVMYARFLPWLSLHSRVSLHWRCGALVATLYVSLDSNKHPWVGNCIKICDNFLAHFVTRMWRVSYPCASKGERRSLDTKYSQLWTRLSLKGEVYYTRRTLTRRVKEARQNPGVPKGQGSPTREGANTTTGA